MLEAVGFPVAVNPETRLAALARKRGWLVEHFSKSPGSPRTLVPIGPRRTRNGGLANPLVPDGWLKARHEGPALRAQRRPASPPPPSPGACAGGAGAKVGPLRLRSIDPPELPGPGWVEILPPPLRHLRLRPLHHRRPQLALLRADRVVPVRARPRGRRRPARGRSHRRCPPVAWSSSRCSAASPAASTPSAPPAPAATSATASTSPSAPSSPASRPASAATPAAAGPPETMPTAPSNRTRPSRQRTLSATTASITVAMPAYTVISQ